MLILGVIVASLLLPAQPASAGLSAERQMVRKANAYRAKHGIPKLRLSKSLMRSSERYSWKQLNGGYYGHSNRIQASSSFRRLGEIINFHRGRKARVRHAFYGWLRSPGHKAIIVDRNFRYVGAGRASGAFRGGSATIWTMHFGAK
jgi:uncharacterized protein YkwD